MNQTYETDDSWDPFASIWYEQPDSESEEFAEWFKGLTKAQQVLFPTLTGFAVRSIMAVFISTSLTQPGFMPPKLFQDSVFSV